MDKTLVVCRFNEDVAWLSDVKGYNIIIYDKGDPTATHHLPNVGREAHAYIHHIIQNYDNLSTINVFSQACPSQHATDFVKKLHNVTDRIKFVGLSDTIMDFTHDEWFDWGGVGHYHEDCRISIGQYFNRLLPEYTCPPTFTTRLNGLFAVHRDRIRYHSLDFYKGIMKDLEEQWTVPYLLERIWQFVFAGPLISRMCVTVEPLCSRTDR